MNQFISNSLESAIPRTVFGCKIRGCGEFRSYEVGKRAKNQKSCRICLRIQIAQFSETKVYFLTDTHLSEPIAICPTNI